MSRAWILPLNKEIYLIIGKTKFGKVKIINGSGAKSLKPTYAEKTRIDHMNTDKVPSTYDLQ